MSAYLSPVFGGGAQLFDNQGIILAGGLINTYAAGSTTPLSTWTDSTQAVQNPNPIVADSAGRLPNEIWLQGGSKYKFVITSATLAPIGYTLDNISGVNDATNTASEWITVSAVPSYISGTSFSVLGNLTGIFQVNRRVQTTNSGGTVYGYIVSAVFGGGITTVVTVNDSGASFDAGISAVNVGLLNAANTSVPNQYVQNTQIASQIYDAFTTGGTSTAYTLTPSPVLSANAAKVRYNVTFNAAPGASPTLAVSGLAALNLKYYDNTGTKQFITSTQVVAGWVSDVINDGTDWVVQSIVPQLLPQDIPVRQTVLNGVQSAGVAAALTTGSGLNPNLAATATPLMVTSAVGYNANGAVDLLEVTSADITGVVGLPANNLSCIYRDIVVGLSSGYGHPPQAKLDLNNGFTDPLGNTWTNTGVTFANATPKFAGTYYGVFGATNNLTYAATTLGNGGWTLRGAFFSTTVATTQNLIEAINAAGFGVVISIQASKLVAAVSSNGTTTNVINSVSGGTTLSNSTWFDLEVTFDPLSGKYYVYLNGVAEAAITTTSSLQVCPITAIYVGYTANSLQGFAQGFEFLPYCKHPAGTSFTPQTALSSVTAFAGAWNSTLAPPQYGYTYNQALQSCLSLNNVGTDDFGNTWTATAITYSNASPAIAGTYMGVFNGTTGKITMPLTSLGSGGWTLRFKFKPSVVAGTTYMMNFGVAGTFGVELAINATKLGWYLSSNGSSFDIVNGTAGATVLANGTSYDAEMCYDPVAGKYFLYLDGTQELIVTSALKICGGTILTLGNNNAGAAAYTGNIQGFEFLPYCLHPNGTAFSKPTTLANVAAAGYASDWFSIADMKMYGVSAASSVAGNNPTFAAKTRTYIGEGTTGAASVSSVVTYAYQRKALVTQATLATSSAYSFNHNLGTTQYSIADASFVCKISEGGWAIGDKIPLTVSPGTGAGAMISNTSRNTSTLATNNTAIGNYIPKTGGSATVLTAANWSFEATVQGRF